jgi:hypothetical protein
MKSNIPNPYYQTELNYYDYGFSILNNQKDHTISIMYGRFNYLIKEITPNRIFSRKIHGRFDHTRYGETIYLYDVYSPMFKKYYEN